MWPVQPTPVLLKVSFPLKCWAQDTGCASPSHAVHPGPQLEAPDTGPVALEPAKALRLAVDPQTQWQRVCRRWLGRRGPGTGALGTHTGGPGLEAAKEADPSGSLCCHTCALAAPGAPPAAPARRSYQPSHPPLLPSRGFSRLEGGPWGSVCSSWPPSLPGGQHSLREAGPRGLAPLPLSAPRRFPGPAGSMPRHVGHSGPCHPRSRDRCDSRGRHAASGPHLGRLPCTHTCPDLMRADGRTGLGTGVPTRGAGRAQRQEVLPGGSRRPCLAGGLGDEPLQG